MFGELTVRPDTHTHTTLHYIPSVHLCACVCGVWVWYVDVGAGEWVFCGLGVVCKEHNIIFRYYFEVIFYAHIYF